MAAGLARHTVRRQGCTVLRAEAFKPREVGLVGRCANVFQRERVRGIAGAGGRTAPTARPAAAAGG